MKWSNGAEYKGSFKDGIKHGFGTYTWPNNEQKYVGNWHEGQRTGEAILTFKDGSSYEGGWVNDMKEGKGVYTYSDGSKYEGYWKNDEKDGEGTLTFSSSHYQAQMVEDVEIRIGGDFNA